MEKRSMERFPLELSARITSIDEGSKELVSEGTTVNICAGGAYFSVEKPLPVSTDTKISILWPPEDFKHGSVIVKDQISLAGRVVRSDRLGMAISFRNNFKFTSIH
jgi:hypothetical protein